MLFRLYHLVSPLCNDVSDSVDAGGWDVTLCESETEQGGFYRPAAPLQASELQYERSKRGFDLTQICEINQSNLDK